MRLPRFVQSKDLANKIASRPIKSLCAAMILSLGLPHAAQAEIFPVYDTMSTEGKPNLAADYGFSRMRLVGTADLWPAGVSMNEPHEATIRALARTLPTSGYVVLDVEHWHLQTSSKVTDAEVENNIRKYIQIIDWMKAENPNLKLGYYAMLPIRNYWDPVLYKSNPNSTNYKTQYDKWVAENARLQPLADKVDAIFPSLYTFYSDQQAWKTFAEENLVQAQQFGKPVISFLWPRFHEGGDATLSHSFVPADYWTMELQTAQRFVKNGQEYAQNGIVLWDSAYKNDPWSTSAPWWTPTVNFLNAVKAIPQPSTKFRLGQRIQTSAVVDVSNTTDISASVLGQQSLGSRGYVFGGPVAADGKNWWQISYKSGAFGWTPEDNLIPAPAGLVGHWGFEETTGPTTRDTTKSLNHGKLTNNPIRSAGVHGRGLSMDGATSKSHVNLGNFPEFNFGTGNFTLSAWVKVKPWTQNDAFIAKGYVGVCCATNGYPGYFLGNYYGKIVLRVEDTAEGRNTVTTAGVTAQTYADKWTHFVGMRKGNVLYLYVNGVQVATSAALPANYNVNNSSPLAVGAQVASTVISNLKGDIDEVRVYNRALSDAEIQTVYNYNAPK